MMTLHQMVITEKIKKIKERKGEEVTRKCILNDNKECIYFRKNNCTYKKMQALCYYKDIREN